MRLEQFVRNRNAFPADELGRYSGQHVAWSPDGTRILTSDPYPMKVLAAVRALEHHPASETSIEDIPAEDTFPAGALFSRGAR